MNQSYPGNPTTAQPVQFQKISLKCNIHKILDILILIVFIVFSLSTLGYVGKYVFGYGRMMGISFHFNLDQEDNIVTYFAALLLLTASLILLFIACCKYKKKEKHQIYWWLLSAIFAYIALDESVEIHERLSDPIKNTWGTFSWFYFAWVIPAMFVIMLLGILFFKFFLNLPRQTKLNFIVAASLYLGGALVTEIIGGHYAYHYGLKNLTYGLITTFEETLELLGVSTFIFALLKFIQQNIARNITFELR